VSHLVKNNPEEDKIIEIRDLRARDVRDENGNELYKMMFENYTIKQWDKKPSELEPSVLQRIPVRTNYDDRYFNDKYEGLPKDGYTSLVRNILNHKNISISLSTVYEHSMKSNYDKIFFTGKIDTYFSDKFGKLEYRSLRFDYETIKVEDYQPVSVVNYPESQYPFTRIIDYKKFYNIKSNKSIIAKEYSQSTGEEYYPIPNNRNRELYSLYQKEAEVLEKDGIYFVGRLANYKYFNMDAAIDNAMSVYQNSEKENI
jgi:UDP-galactopyranose mutase